MLLLETAENYPERFWLTYDQEASTKASLLSMCTPLEEKNPVFIAKSEKKLSVQEIQSFDIIESDMMSFVSKRLADILVDYPEDVEIFEAKIVIAGEIVPGFFALNVLNKKQCIDLEASDYRPILDGYPEEGLRFYSIKTYPDTVLDGANIVRAHESEGNIFISNALAKRIQDAGIKNLLLVDATDTTAIA
ncbi:MULTISPECIES: DUF1629 domain-containing protein [Pseudomonas]|uniref:imm11 family protein n=1 Tax=Pseudomonas TaxID=286 RepID=UPI00137AF54B|nr:MULTISPECIES: DUF1629 domain-containing protein [Pseudomonas]